jgi:hypothetical protein
MRQLQKSNITVMLMVGASPVPAPLGRPRPHLTEDGTMTSSKSDMAWLPEYDPQFSVWVRQVCEKYGWPKGPLTAFNLWNEPWEGLSISGWGADMLRYREIYKAMADGVWRPARPASRCCSPARTRRPTRGTSSSRRHRHVLPILDAMTIHYQGMASPAVYKKFRERTSPLGRVGSGTRKAGSRTRTTASPRGRHQPRRRLRPLDGHLRRQHRERRGGER